MTTLPKPELSGEMRQYLTASSAKLEACVATVQQQVTISSPSTLLRFHHLKFDANGKPKFKDLAECLADHITQYCFTAKRRNDAKSEDERNRLNREARSYLRKSAQSGEAGEILLYFLLEAVAGAPQLVAKTELKTNPKLENFGSDGIHMRWSEKDSILEVVFGESKLEKTLYSGIASAVESLNNFHERRQQDHEIKLVTSLFKYESPAMRSAVLRWLDRQLPGGDFRVVHGCLLGYNEKLYKGLGKTGPLERGAKFQELFVPNLEAIKGQIEQGFKKLKPTHLTFEIFILPFVSVQKFRTEFNKALS